MAQEPRLIDFPSLDARLDKIERQLAGLATWIEAQNKVPRMPPFQSYAASVVSIGFGGIAPTSFQANSIEEAAFAAGAVSARVIANGAIDSATFAFGAINNAALAGAALDNRITAGSFIPGSITNGAFAAGALSGLLIRRMQLVDVDIADPATSNSAPLSGFTDASRMVPIPLGSTPLSGFPSNATYSWRISAYNTTSVTVATNQGVGGGQSTRTTVLMLEQW